MSIESVMPSNHLSSFVLPSIFPSIRVFSNELALHIRWPKYWSFSFNISPSNEYSELISFRIDWFDRLAVQGTLKTLLQHNSSKASIVWALVSHFSNQFLHLYKTTGKTIALTIWTFVSKVMSLLFNELFSFVTAVLARRFQTSFFFCPSFYLFIYFISWRLITLQQTSFNFMAAVTVCSVGTSLSNWRAGKKCLFLYPS